MSPIRSLTPISKEPDFKFCAVHVEKYRKPKQAIVVIGAGAGAFGFVKSYREINKEDEIIVFNRENFPFYNRVLLLDYIIYQRGANVGTVGKDEG